MSEPLRLPAGKRLVHEGTTIAFVEVAVDWIYRFVIDGTDDEFLIELASGARVRPTLAWILAEFQAGRLKEKAASSATSDWNGRFLGLDRSICARHHGRALRKHDIAMEAIRLGLGCSQKRIKAFLDDFLTHADDRISERTVMRWTAQLLVDDLRIGSLVNRSGRPKGKSQLPPLMDRLVHQAAALYYGAPLNKMDAPALVVAAWRRLDREGVQGIGRQPPSKTTVINRINRMEDMETYGQKHGRDEAARRYGVSGESEPVLRPLELVYIDGTELEQIAIHSEDWPIPDAKLKIVRAMCAASLYSFRSPAFAGPYRAETGLGAIMGVLTPPQLTAAELELDPLEVLCFGRIGRLRGDNDKALLPPGALANLSSVIAMIELARRYGPNEKSPLEAYWDFVKARLRFEPGTVLSGRNRRRRSVRRDPLAEASLTISELAHKDEALRREWNETPKGALGGRTPRDVLLEHVMSEGVRLIDPGETRRHVARTVRTKLTNKGIFVDGILYRWDRDGATRVLSDNAAGLAMGKQVDHTATADVAIRVYDWDLDFIEVFDEANGEFVRLWSSEPAYTRFLTRWEHRFFEDARRHGEGGAHTLEDRLERRAQTILGIDATMEKLSFAERNKAAAILRMERVRAKALNVADDPDLTDFADLLTPTGVRGARSATPPFGPPQSGFKVARQGKCPAPERPSGYGWGGVDPAEHRRRRPDAALVPTPNAGEDPDDGIAWDDDYC